MRNWRMQATRDDAQPKRGKTAALAVGLGFGVGLALGVGLGVGLGANLNAIGALSVGRTTCITPPPSARARFLACSMTEADDVPSPEELEAMLARQRARGAEPKWGTP